MTDLSGPAREALRPLAPEALGARGWNRPATNGATARTLWKGHDGTRAESVLMR